MQRETEHRNKNWPISGAALDAIKLIAAVLMVVDHVDDILFDRTMPHLMLLGRAVMPLFCFATAAYIYRAGIDKIPNYVTKILILAIFVQPISYVTRDYADGNILFMLGIGAILVGFMASASHRMRCLAFLFSFLAAGIPSVWEYGIVGAFLPAAMYLVMKEGDRYIPWLVFTLALANFGGMVEDFTKGLSVDVVIGGIMVSAATILFPMGIVFAAKNIKGRGRLMPKYFLHAFYPLHLIGIAAVGYFISMS